MKKIRKYCPSNGSEGEGFIETYCMHCKFCDPDPNGETQCLVLYNSLSYDVDDEEYPVEWILDDKDQPTCTKHVFFDWDNGKPEKKEILPKEQLKLFKE